MASPILVWVSLRNASDMIAVGGWWLVFVGVDSKLDVQIVRVDAEWGFYSKKKQKHLYL